MKAVLIALNSSFVHTNLAVRLLEKSSGENVPILELTINEEEKYLLKKILDSGAKYIFWSAYIWNWELIRELGDRLNKMGLDIHQFVGGPEVTYDVREHLEDNPWISGIMVGEGECIFPDLLRTLKKGGDWRKLPGMAYKSEGGVAINPGPTLPMDLDYLPSLDYKTEDLSNKIIYYEAMRGCPYNCLYCLSSLDQKVRYRSIEKIKEDLLLLFQTGSKQIKFVDRSFSINKTRALEIIHYIKENAPEGLNVHFEMNLENLDQEIIDALISAPSGLFQIEAGVQSTNSTVLKEIDRATDIGAVGQAMKKLEESPIHRHLDLIVGLPGEDKESFFQGFDHLYQMKPERIQIGFLKLLRGTKLRERSKELGIEYQKKAPYTVIKTKELSAKDIIDLQYFEEIVENYCDEHKFDHLNRFIIEERGKKPWEYFSELAKFYQDKVETYQIKGLRGKYSLLYDYLGSKSEYMGFYDYFKMDFYLQEDHIFERVIQVEDREMEKGEIIDWLRDLDEEVYQEFGKDLHKIARICRGVVFKNLGIERLHFYKDHKYVKHVDRRQK